jgi:hypothetical protein
MRQKLGGAAAAIRIAAATRDGAVIGGVLSLLIYAYLSSH